jgi:Type IV pilin-like G and H, putative
MKKRILRILVGLLWVLIGSVIAGFFGILISILTGNGLSIGTQPRTIETQIIGTSQIVGAVIGASFFLRQGWNKSWTKQMSLDLGTVVSIILLFVVINLNVGNKSQMREEAGKALYAINSMQQVSYLMNNQFATSVEQLDFKNNSDFYRYDVIEVDALKAISRATPKRDDLKSFVAGISKMNDKFLMIVCGSRNNSKNIQNPIFDRTTWTCGQDSEKISERVSS